MLRQRGLNSNESNENLPQEYHGNGTADESKMKTNHTYINQQIYFRKLRNFRILVVGCFLCLLLTYLGIPFAFKFIPFIRQHMIFMNYVNLPPFQNLSDPMGEFYGLNSTRSLYLNTDDGITLGVWHILPKSRISGQASGKILEKDFFKDNRPIFLYLHGNGGARGGAHRRELYKVLAYSDIDAHVVTMDYRGYGDSSNIKPSAPGLFADAEFVYKWLINQVHRSRVYVWGHSLGTSVAVNFISRLPKDSMPSGVILESPFTSIADAVKHHPFSMAFRIIPNFDWFFVDPIKEDENTNFDSVSHIGKVTAPLVILHAQDDRIIPLSFGMKLNEIAKSDRPKTSQPVKMVIFNASHGYGHKYIARDPDLPNIIVDFINSASVIYRD